MQKTEDENLSDEEIKNETEIINLAYNFHTKSYLNLNGYDWRIGFIDILPKSLNFQKEVENNLKLIDIFIDKIPSFQNDLKMHRTDVSKYPNTIIVDFKTVIEDFLSAKFSIIEKNDPEIFKSVKNLEFETIVFINEKSVLPCNIGSKLSQNLRNSDFYWVFWFCLMLLEKSLKTFIIDKKTKTILMQNFFFVQRLNENFPSILNLLKIMAIAAETNEFCFNYVSLIVLNVLILINPLKTNDEQFGDMKTRLALLNVLSRENPSHQNFVKTIEIINELFKKLDLGEAYFKIWEKICLSSNNVLCELIHPDLKPSNFTKNHLEETSTLSKSLLFNVKNKIFSFPCVPEKNRALTLVNNSIGFHTCIINKAILGIEGKFELIISGFHEFGHLEGLNSYKNQNYFNVTPLKFNYEAGIYLQQTVFHGIHEFSQINEKENENRIKEALLFLVRDNYSKEDLGNKLDPINFKITKLDKNKKNKENLLDLIKKMYEKDDDNKEECGYSMLRNNFLKGFYLLYQKD